MLCGAETVPWSTAELQTVHCSTHMLSCFKWNSGVVKVTVRSSEAVSFHTFLERYVVIIVKLERRQYSSVDC